MSQPTLFDLPEPTGPSKHAQLQAFKAAHGILTHYNKACAPFQWMALLPFDDDKGKDIGTICAESAGLYEDTNRLVTGKGELSVVRELAELNAIHCPF
jgi:hypothetical protein